MRYSAEAVRGLGMTSPRARERMVLRLRQQGIVHQTVIKAMKQTPRHLFVDEAMDHLAYEDKSLPIGYNQTISQPYIVARMAEILLDDQERIGKVLEVGTGCGYQAAILSQIAAEVYTVERIEGLHVQAKECLEGLSYDNVKALHSDGNWGLKSHSPYDGILLTAAAQERVPKELLYQLSTEGGRLVMPMTMEATGKQELILVRRFSSEDFEWSSLEEVTFVPLIEGTS